MARIGRLVTEFRPAHKKPFTYKGNTYGSLFLPNQESKKRNTILMTLYKISGKQYETFCNFTVQQKFKNISSEPVEVCYTFPNDSKYCIYDSLFIINGNEIKPTIKQKEEAKEEYKEAIESDLSAMYGENIGNGLSMFKLGNLNPNEEVEINFTFSFLSVLNQNGSSLKFPIQTNFQSGIVTSNKNYPVCSFSFDLFTQHFSNIKDIHVNCPADIKIDDDSDKANISIKKMPKEPAILIDVEYVSIPKSCAISSDDTTLLTPFVNIIPSDERISNGDFIFLLDCSGSMQGQRIKSAKQCLKIMIKSLPFGCRFSIQRFGSNYKVELNTSDYTNDNAKIALSIANNIKADLGGTDIYHPLKSIFDSPQFDGDDSYMKQIFLITDGEVYNTDEIIKLVHQNRSKCRIFTVGIGEADPGIIENLAHITQGASTFIDTKDDLETYEMKMIDLLEASLSPALTNVEILGDSEIKEIWPNPLPSIYSNTQGTILISGKQDLITLKGRYFDQPIIDEIECMQIPEIIGLKQYFMMQQIQDDLLFNENDDNKDKIIALSIASNVLCRYTAYVGIDVEQLEEKKEVTHLVGGQTARQFCSRGIGGYGLGRGGPYRKTIEESESEDEETDIDKIISSQNVDGSWDNFDKIDDKIKDKFGKKAAATVQALAMIHHLAGKNINSYRLIIRKAYRFLSTIEASINWDSIVQEHAREL